MPWKEPGEKPREPRDVWGSRGDTDDRSGERSPARKDSGNNGGGNRPGNGFDPEALWKRLRQRLERFGGGTTGALALIILILVLWFALGSWSLIDARQTGVVLRFGQYERTLGPGLHLHLPRPFAQVLKVDVGRSRTVSDQLRMLTRDGQIALVDFYVQYKVNDARKFLFAVRDPEDAMRDATLAAVRAQIGKRTLQELMAKSDNTLATHITGNLQHTLDAYGSGISVTDAGVQSVSVPQEVKDAYDDIGNARQDAQRIENGARAIAVKSQADARTQAAQWHTEADVYKAQQLAEAQGEAARFDLILSAYRAAPDMTRQRLWQQTMQDVLGASRSVVNTGSGSVVVQVPAQTPASVSDNENDSGSSSNNSGNADATDDKNVPKQPAETPAPAQSQGGGT